MVDSLFYYYYDKDLNQYLWRKYVLLKRDNVTGAPLYNGEPCCIGDKFDILTYYRIGPNKPKTLGRIRAALLGDVGGDDYHFKGYETYSAFSIYCRKVEK